MMMVHAALFMLVGIAFIIDARKSMIPNRLTVTGVITGGIMHTCTQGWNGLWFALVGALSGFLALIVLYALGALGAGDVKLFAAIGSIMGTAFVIQSIYYALLFAGVIGIGLLIASKKMAETGHKLAGWLISLTILRDKSFITGMKRQINIKFPFMYAALPGVLLVWYENFI
ncbi:A24 family peptidase [Paenibacillus aestuarii]|uniref:Prepilin peptidase n=1 Tax=Paenibacillus aestuarii TaxID=516965 RepID=A0ABW0KIJ8_9BACL|nr:A24 family peptidase [Paenibacillus aestuarii]